MKFGSSAKEDVTWLYDYYVNLYLELLCIMRGVKFLENCDDFVNIFGTQWVVQYLQTAKNNGFYAKELWTLKTCKDTRMHFRCVDP